MQISKDAHQLKRLLYTINYEILTFLTQTWVKDGRPEEGPVSTGFLFIACGLGDGMDYHWEKEKNIVENRIWPGNYSNFEKNFLRVVHLKLLLDGWY